MKQQGFTLLELMAVCLIMSLMAFIGSSGYGFMITQSNINNDKMRLLSMVQMTRQLSITNSAVTVLCPTEDNTNCVRDWNLPFIQFHDLNKNNKRDPDEAITQRFEPFDREDTVLNFPKTQIRFNEEGFANYYNGTLSYCSGDVIAGLIISRIGRIRYAQDINGDHIPDVNSSTPVTCKSR